MKGGARIVCIGRKTAMPHQESWVKIERDGGIVAQMRERASHFWICLLSVLFGAYLLGACGHTPLHHDPATCEAVPPGRYFRVGPFQAGEAYPRAAWDQRWYGGQLCAMDEEPL